MIQRFPLGLHPVEKIDYVLVTQAGLQLERFTQRMLKSGIAGFVVLGDSRVGKTWAMLYVMANLSLYNVKIPCTLVLPKHRPRQTSLNQHYRAALETVEHELAANGMSDAKRQRWVEHVLSLAHESGQNRVVVFVDDAQVLTLDQLGFLMNEYNTLLKRGVRVLYVLIAQPEFEVLRKLLLEKDVGLSRDGARDATNKGEYRRFCSQMFRTLGTITADDFKEVCRAFDNNSTFPQASDVSYTAYFWPTAFANGWRLEHLAPMLFDCFLSLKIKFGIRERADIGMEYVTHTINQLMIDFQDLNILVPQIRQEDILLRILYTGYVGAYVAGREDDIAREIAGYSGLDLQLPDAA